MYGRKRKQHTYLTCDYGRTYGKTAAEQIDGHGQWLSLREDALLPLVETFFAQRIFGPMRLEKLERQLLAHQRSTQQGSAAVQRRLRERIADLDERIGRQIEALERGIEPDLIAKRIAKLRNDKETAEAELRVLHPSDPGSDATESLREALRRMPDLSQGLRDAPAEVKRQVFDAFGLQIVYDKPNRRIEISATITEAIAHALHNAEDLPQEAFVAHTDIAGAGFEPATFGL